MAESMYRLTFGKHSGEDIEDVPDYYLNWLLGEEWFEEKHPAGYAAVKREMDYREQFDRHIWEDRA